MLSAQSRHGKNESVTQPCHSSKITDECLGNRTVRNDSLKRLTTCFSAAAGVSPSQTARLRDRCRQRFGYSVTHVFQGTAASPARYSAVRIFRLTANFFSCDAMNIQHRRAQQTCSAYMQNHKSVTILVTFSVITRKISVNFPKYEEIVNWGRCFEVETGRCRRLMSPLEVVAQGRGTAGSAAKAPPLRLVRRRLCRRDYALTRRLLEPRSREAFGWDQSSAPPAQPPDERLFFLQRRSSGRRRRTSPKVNEGLGPRGGKPSRMP